MALDVGSANALRLHRRMARTEDLLYVECPPMCSETILFIARKMRLDYKPKSSWSPTDLQLELIVDVYVSANLVVMVERPESFSVMPARQQVFAVPFRAIRGERARTVNAPQIRKRLRIEFRTRRMDLSNDSTPCMCRAGSYRLSEAEPVTLFRIYYLLIHFCFGIRYGPQLVPESTAAPPGAGVGVLAAPLAGSADLTLVGQFSVPRKETPGTNRAQSPTSPRCSVTPTGVIPLSPRDVNSVPGSITPTTATSPAALSPRRAAVSSPNVTRGEQGDATLVGVRGVPSTQGLAGSSSSKCTGRTSPDVPIGVEVMDPEASDVTQEANPVVRQPYVDSATGALCFGIFPVERVNCALVDPVRDEVHLVKGLLAGDAWRLVSSKPPPRDHQSTAKVEKAIVEAFRSFSLVRNVLSASDVDRIRHRVVPSPRPSERRRTATEASPSPISQLELVQSVPVSPARVSSPPSRAISTHPVTPEMSISADQTSPPPTARLEAPPIASISPRPVSLLLSRTHCTQTTAPLPPPQVVSPCVAEARATGSGQTQEPSVRSRHPPPPITTSPVTQSEPLTPSSASDTWSLSPVTPVLSPGMSHRSSSLSPMDLLRPSAAAALWLSESPQSRAGTVPRTSPSRQSKRVLPTIGNAASPASNRTFAGSSVRTPAAVDVGQSRIGSSARVEVSVATRGNSGTNAGALSTSDTRPPPDPVLDPYRVSTNHVRDGDPVIRTKEPSPRSSTGVSTNGVAVGDPQATPQAGGLSPAGLETTADASDRSVTSGTPSANQVSRSSLNGPASASFTPAPVGSIINGSAPANPVALRNASPNAVAAVGPAAANGATGVGMSANGISFPPGSSWPDSKPALRSRTVLSPEASPPIVQAVTDVKSA